MFHIGEEVLYRPMQENLKEFAGRAEIYGVSSVDDKEEYRIIAHKGKKRLVVKASDLTAK